MSIYGIVSGVCAMSAATAKSVLNAIAAANAPIKVKEFAVSFDGVTSSAVPALVELGACTQGAAGTAGSAPTPARRNGPVRTVAWSAGANYSSEPTTITVLDAWYVPVFNGIFVKQYALGDEPDTEVSASTEGLLLRVTAAATVNCRASMAVQEG